MRLQGGFDGTTPSGAIGIAHGYDNVALSSLKTLSYDFRVLKRPGQHGERADDPRHACSRPTTGTTSGFTNFVFEPYMQGDFGLNQRYAIDAMAGKWWSTRKTGGIDRCQARPHGPT